MKIIRFQDPDGNVYHGVESAPGKAHVLTGELFDSPTVTDLELEVAKVLYPLEPTAILGIGANYKEAFVKAGKPFPEYPIVFFKCNNALQHPGEPVELPRKVLRAETVKFEGELAVIIGKTGKNIPESEALDYVCGYTIANDVSGSDWQGDRVGKQWCKGKGFDTFLPLGPAMITADEAPDPAALRVITTIDGNVEQNELVGEMVFSVQQLIAFLSAGHTLKPGNIILTGTPPGARFLEPGEHMEITIDPIGKLANPVIEEPV